MAAETTAADGPAVYFSETFGVSKETLDAYGAFDISLISDLPLFVDPFLLFHSDKAEYQALHEGIIRYLVFLRDHADADLDQGLIDAWYRFKEVKQNWLGFTYMGNEGHGLGPKFARGLHRSLGDILSSFGKEDVTRSSHLEKVCLIGSGVGRDNMSDFTTNLIKHYLCEYTSAFASEHIDSALCAEHPVTRAAFNYDTESWETRTYLLPSVGGDFVLLTPKDLLTRDEAWINYGDMIRRFDLIPDALGDGALRAQVNNYFRRQLGRDPKQADRDEAARRTYQEFPELIDYYIRHKEDTGDRATAQSRGRVDKTDETLVIRVRRLLEDLAANSAFNQLPWDSYDEALTRVQEFKHYIEDCDGYRLLNYKDKPLANEKDVQLFFGMAWFGSAYDLNREVNNGRGPVDFAVSRGAKDKSLVEFKLASNTALKRNLQKQVGIYEKANGVRTSVTVIVIYSGTEERKVQKILRELKLTEEASIVLIDARRDNKPSGSKA
jgi:hypothetical protein